jgi:hypothetical protein
LGKELARGGMPKVMDPAAIDLQQLQEPLEVPR